MTAGTAITTGEQPLQRLWSVNVPNAQLDNDVNRILLQEAQKYRLPGFRKTAKVVPPAFRRQHAPRITAHLLTQMTEPLLLAKVKEESLDILPSVLLKDHQRQGAETAVTYQFEVKPEIAPPDFAKHTLKNPQAKLDDAAYTKIIDRMRRQHARFKEVARPAAIGDKLRIQLPTAAKPQEVDINEGLEPHLLEKFTGANPGDEVAVDLSSPQQVAETINVKILAVLEPQLPELDVDFARKIIPGVPSVDDFHKGIRMQVEKQGARLARYVLCNRVTDLLSKATADFDIPEQHVATTVNKRMQAILEDAHKKGHNIGPEHIDQASLLQSVRKETRSSLIVAKYAKVHNLVAAPDKIAAFIAAEASDHANPQDYIAFARNDEQTQKNVEREVIQDAINAKVITEVTTEADLMDIDQLNQAQQGHDPEIPPDNPPPKEATP